MFVTIKNKLFVHTYVYKELILEGKIAYRAEFHQNLEIILMDIKSCFPHIIVACHREIFSVN